MALFSAFAEIPSLFLQGCFDKQCSTMKKKLLIIEDEVSVAKQLKWGLEEEYAISIASNASDAEPFVASGAFPVILLDLGLPPYPDTPQEGFELLPRISKLAPHAKVIVVTGNAERKNAVKSISMGASDFCEKPIDLDEIKIILARTYSIYSLEEEVRFQKLEQTQSGALLKMLGTSPLMESLFKNIKKISSNDLPVLLQGEVSTGKALTAETIHSLSHRDKKPFIVLDAASVAKGFFDEELIVAAEYLVPKVNQSVDFNLDHIQGATILLKNVDLLPRQQQERLLAFLDSGFVQGSETDILIKLNCRVIASTSKDLSQELLSGNFSEALYNRLKVNTLRIPPLKNRTGDILLLAHHFLHVETSVMKRERFHFSPAAYTALTLYSWPGNIGELKDRIHKSLMVCASLMIKPEDLGLGGFFEYKEACAGLTLQQVRENAEKSAIRSAMITHDNDQQAAADALDVSVAELSRLVAQYEL